MTDQKKLRVLVVGGLGPNGSSGGREHALAWAASRSPRCEALFVAPGNGGTPGIAVPAGTDLVAFCQSERIDLALIGPDASLAAGIVDDSATDAFTASVRPGTVANCEPISTSPKPSPSKSPMPATVPV